MNAEGVKFNIPNYEPSGWRCELFGLGANGMVLMPAKGQVPNFFWRWMQYLAFGNRWRRVKSDMNDDGGK